MHQWRDHFFALCKDFNIQPAEACFNYGFNIPGVKSVALNTSNPNKVQRNIAMATKQIQQGFWDAMREKGLI